MVYFAHTCKGHPQPDDRWQLLAMHLREVARLAEYFAKEAVSGLPGADDDCLKEQQCFVAAARHAGLLHDIGKYQAGFQDYLRAVARGLPHRKVPHAPTGAAKAISALGAIAHGFVPAGHHQGLPTPQVLKRYCSECGVVADKIWPDAIEDCQELKSLYPLMLPDAIAKDPLRCRCFHSHPVFMSC